MNKFTLFFLFFLILLALTHLQAQEPDTLPKVVPGKIIDGDTVPLVEVKSITVYPPYEFKNRRHQVRYSKLVYNIQKVYPYAKQAGEKLEEFQRVLDTITNEREQRKYAKLAEKQLEEEFGEDIRNLTFSQGKILIKLIYRQTGSSSFEIVKELRGKFTAFIWQTLATIFGYDLKAGYDPEGEDRQIEEIILLIDQGYF
ncbi:MAG: DUF4294 domain-containing protein [Bacteroidales bacterium]|nr:DUF4294 domain-containing protein [Bacteroidales bacterium]